MKTKRLFAKKKRVHRLIEKNRILSHHDFHQVQIKTTRHIDQIRL